MVESTRPPAGSLLARAEAALERTVDGWVRRGHRGRIQPVEIATQLTRHAEAARMISLKHSYVPSRYVIWVHPSDMAVLESFAGEIEAEFAAYLGEWITEREYTVSQPVQVAICPRENVEPGRFTIHSAWSTSPTAVEAEQPTMVSQAVMLGDPVGELQGLSGPDEGQVFPVFSERIVLGRASDCSVQLRDLLVSRHHAALERRGQDWVVEDLGSTNGTRVNGKRIQQQATLESGDVIRVGDSTLRLVVRSTA